MVLGTEGDGIGARTVAAADLTVRIPMAVGWTHSTSRLPRRWRWALRVPDHT